MSDVSVSIQIGGTIDAEGRKALAAAVVDDRVSTDWSGPPIDDEGEVLERLFSMKGGDGTFDLYDDTSKHGKMDRIEQACRDHGVCYSRHREPSDGDDGDVTYWLPGRLEPKTVSSNSDGRAVLVAEDLLEAVETAVQAGTDAMTALREQIADSTLPAIPPLNSIGDHA